MMYNSIYRKRVVRLETKKEKQKLYDQVKAELVKRITDGTYEVGSFIPPENVLKEEFDVSRITIRRAINELAQEGLLLAHPGIGTKVIRPLKLDESLGEICSFTNVLKAYNLQPNTISLSVDKVIIPKNISKEMNLKDNTLGYHIYRVRGANNVSVAVFETYVVTDIKLSIDPNDYYGSLHEIFRNNGIIPTFIEESVEAVAATKKLARELNVRTGFPLLKSIRKVYDQTGRLFEYSILHYNSTNFKYITHSTAKLKENNNL